jgi:hypothetical protein
MRLTDFVTCQPLLPSSVAHPGLRVRLLRSPGRRGRRQEPPPPPGNTGQDPGVPDDQASRLGRDERRRQVGA